MSRKHFSLFLMSILLFIFCTNSSLCETSRIDTFTIVNCESIMDYRFTSSIEKFQFLHPQVDIQYVTLDESKVSALLSSQSSDIDILYVDSETLRIYAPESLLSLSSFDTVKANLAYWCSLNDIVGTNDEIFCIPAHILADILLPHSCFPIHTWNEILSCEKTPSSVLLYDNIHYPAFVEQYVLSCVTDNAPLVSSSTLCNYLNCYKQLVQQNLIEDIFSSNNEGLASYNITVAVSPDEMPYIPPYPLAINNHTYTPGYVIGIAANKYSKHIDYIKDFISIYSSPDIQSDIRGFGYLTNINLYNDSDSLDDTTKQQISRNLEYFSTLQPKIVDAQFTSTLWDLFDAFYADTIAVTELESCITNYIINESP